MATKKLIKKPPLAEVQIVERQDKTEDLSLVWLEKPDGYSFKPGQYCTIGHKGIERAYSIASAPHEKYIELFIELVPVKEGGVLTPILWDLHEGDKVTIRPRAKGIFTFKEEKQNQFLVSTVTGVVPYVSFVRDYIEANKEGHHFYVLEGASYQDEFVYDDEFIAIAKERPDLLTFVPTVSRPTENKNDSWNGEKGRVNKIVQSKIREFGLETINTMIYACGHPGMIEDVKQQVVPLGFEFLEERFWKDD
ncbi:MAG: ferredoxin--NADP reductase [Dehalococcoidia bacterium]